MKQILLLLISLLLIGSLSAQNIESEKSFETLLENAEKEHKNVLLVFSGSDWCGTCIKFKKNILDSEIFENFSEDKLILHIADFPRKENFSKEKKAENIHLFKKYNKKGFFPYVVLLNTKGDVLKQLDTSYFLPENFINQF